MRRLPCRRLRRIAGRATAGEGCRARGTREVAEGLFKARRALRVKAMRCGFGRGGYWTWKLPGYMTDKDVHFHPGEWRSFIAGHREWLTPVG